MILNLLHRPAHGAEYRLFRLQQEMAHRLKLKVTLLLDPPSLYDELMIAEIQRDAADFGDELGIWFSGFDVPEFAEKIGGKEAFIWLYSEEEKRKILQMFLQRFREVYQKDPVSVGSYHFDAGCLRLLRELAPSVKVAVAGCFEEGVKVFHGCNNSWYLFNEGMPWAPWYPSKTHSLRPAVDDADAAGIVAVPHLSRDLVLSYEGRNDFFATHPANVQRAMAYHSTDIPYMYNLVDQHRMQELYNEGYSYCHVFVGAGWLIPNHNAPDPEEISQQLYLNFLDYFVKLRDEGKLTDLHMSEFADWYRAHVPIGKPQVALAKDILYGSGKHYFWYIDPYCRVLIDANQAGSIGDLRPYAGQVACETGPDQPAGMFGSYPYLIHSQYRTGQAHHFVDGARTTLLVTHQEQTLDLAICQTKVAKVERNAVGTHVTLTPARLKFEDGLTVEIETVYHFEGQGNIRIVRRVIQVSQPDTQLVVQEYLKGCYGVTEYPQDMHGIELELDGKQAGKIQYSYRSRTLTSQQAQRVAARVGPIQTEVSLEAGQASLNGSVIEGYLFNPYFTLKLDYATSEGKEVETWLRIRQNL